MKDPVLIPGELLDTLLRFVGGRATQYEASLKIAASHSDVVRITNNLRFYIKDLASSKRDIFLDCYTWEDFIDYYNDGANDFIPLADEEEWSAAIHSFDKYSDGDFARNACSLVATTVEEMRRAKAAKT